MTTETGKPDGNRIYHRSNSAQGGGLPRNPSFHRRASLQASYKGQRRQEAGIGAVNFVRSTSVTDTSTLAVLRSFTRSQWLTLATQNILIFCSTMAYSLLSPFFPDEADKKDASPFMVGLIFGIYELVIFILSPIYGMTVSSSLYIVVFHGFIIAGSLTRCLFHYGKAAGLDDCFFHQLQ